MPFSSSGVYSKDRDPRTSKSVWQRRTRSPHLVDLRCNLGRIFLNLITNHSLWVSSATMTRIEDVLYEVGPLRKAWDLRVLGSGSLVQSFHQIKSLSACVNAIIWVIPIKPIFLVFWVKILTIEAQRTNRKYCPIEQIFCRWIGGMGGQFLQGIKIWFKKKLENEPGIVYTIFR